MYDFRFLDAYYDIDITLEFPDYRHTYYHCREHIIARYDKEKDIYIFRLEEREDISINQQKPTELMDQLMIEFGNLLYPIELSVSPLGEITKVVNFEEIKERWYTESEKILHAQHTHHLERYLQISSRNMKDEVKLRESLMNNSFIKLMIKPLVEKGFLFSFKDFPSKGGIVLYHCQSKQEDENSEVVTQYEAKLAHPSDCKGDGYVQYTFSELRDVLDVDARFDLEDENGQKWMKRITIKADKKQRGVSRKKHTWSMFD